MKLLIIFILVFVPCGFLSSTIAAMKDYDRVNWFFAGLFFGPLGLIAVTGLPDQKLRRYIRLLAKAQGVESDDLAEYPYLPPVKLSLMPNNKK